MKIFNAMFSKVNGGLEQVFLNYIPALELQGNLVVPIIHPKAEIKNSCPPAHLKMVHNFNQHDYFAIYKLRQLIKQERPDCVITHSYRAAYLFQKTRTRVPKIAVCHVKGHYDFGSDAIIAITEQMRQDIIAAGKPANSVFTIPNMIHLPQELTYKAPKVNDVPVIGVCARFVPVKGVDVFINALAELKRQNIAFKALIAGDGKEKEQYIELIKTLGLEDEVTLLGWIDQKDDFYETIDVFCLPSRQEAFGLVILESMKHSLPMVLTDLSGPREIIADSKSALFVPPEDPMSLAHGLKRIIEDREMAKELSRNAFKRVQQYSSQVVGPMLHDVLQQICREHRSNTN